MAFDPQREDYQRLGLRYARTLDARDAASATRAFAAFGRKFAQDRDALPQSDSDRAFHLVAMATKLIDYELPFATDDHAQELIENGHRLLDEALTLDPQCYDALRMKTAALSNSFEDFLSFLSERADEVRAHCDQRAREEAADETGERARMCADLALRPYLRWLATQAEQALICGRNKEALRVALECLRLDPCDAADARFTAAYAYAKLEDAAGLEAHAHAVREAGVTRPDNDAWTLIARMALCFKQLDRSGAQQWLDQLLRTYPHAAEALIRQAELPDGIFARLATVPYSEDELIVALSEGAVLLQEGVDPMGRGTLSTWLSEQTAKLRPQAMLSILAAHRDASGQGDRS